MNKRKVLVVDDVELNRDILEGILEDDYDVVLAQDGRQALDLIFSMQDDLAIVLLDLMMPEVDGFGVLDEMVAHDLLKKIPVIIITGDNNIESEKRCFGYGIVDFVRKPFDGALVLLRVSNAVELFSYKNALEQKVSEQTEVLQKQNARLAWINDKTVDLLASVVEYRDSDSGIHIQRIRAYTKALAKQLMVDYPEYGLTDEVVETMSAASLLHDVGKVAIPDAVLLKNGRLNDEEYNIIKGHTVSGGEIIEGMKGIWDDDFYQMSYDICRHHHERYDGKGYPDKLAGDDIPISAQIVAIADVYDALINKRCYKDSYSKDVAFNMILNGECGTFSSKILDCFGKARFVFEKLADEMADEEA